MKITVLGSGTSSGVPLIGCRCSVCTSRDPRDNRLRPSIAISYGDRRFVIDTTPDFRAQALRSNLERVDAVLFTHSHADHIMGLDDVRPYNFHQGGRIPYLRRRRHPLHGAPSVPLHLRRARPHDLRSATRHLRSRRPPARSVRPPLRAHPRPARQRRPSSVIASATPPISPITAKYRPNPWKNSVASMCSFSMRSATNRTLPTRRSKLPSDPSALSRPEQAFLTHISHDLAHAETERGLPDGIRLAYDGLEIDVA